MTISFAVKAVREYRWDTPLNSLRLLAVLAFGCVSVAMLFPSTQRFLEGGCFSLTGMLAVQLFRLKDVEERPDPRDGEFTVLGLGKS